MSGETIVVSAMPRNNAYRFKRVRRDEPRASKPMVQDVRVPNKFLDNQIPDYARPDSTSSEADSQTLQETSVTRPDMYTNKSAEPETPIPPRSQSPSNKSKKRRHSHSTDIEVDLSHVPSDPQRLRTWLAEQISHYQSTESPQQSRESSSPFEINDVFDSNSHLDKNTKGTNSQRWDTRKASKKMHDQETNIVKGQRHHNTPTNTRVGASKHLTKNNVKLRANHEIKQRSDSKVPKSVCKPHVYCKIFTSQNMELRPEVREIGALAIQTVFPSAHCGHLQSESETADTLCTALKRLDFNAQFLIEALKIIAKQTSIMLDTERSVSHDQNSNASKEDDSNSRSIKSTVENIDDSNQPNSTATQQVDEIIRALNGATALLNEMADNKVYVTPYGNPPPRNSTLIGFGAQNETSGSSSSRGANDFVFDNTQIDAVLALASGGSLTDDEDDKTIADPDEFNDQLLDASDMVDGDIDVAATLQRVIGLFMATRNTDRPSNDRPSSSTIDLNGSPSIVEQATSLQSLFKRAKVSINKIVPLAQGYATSQFYAHLSSYAQPPEPSSGMTSATTGTYGDSTQMNYGLVPHPGALGYPQYFFGPPQPLSNYYLRGESGIPPPMMMDPKIQRKIAIYGCPPFPGSRIVSRAQ